MDKIVPLLQLLFLLHSSCESVIALDCPAPSGCECHNDVDSPDLLDITCNISYIPLTLPNRTAVLTLNDLSSLTLSPGDKIHLPHLRSLTINDGSLRRLDSHSFRWFPATTHLTLSDFALENVANSTFASLLNLVSLKFEKIPMRILDLSRSLISINKQTFREIQIRCNGRRMVKTEIMDQDVYRCYQNLQITRMSVTFCSVAVMRNGFSQYFPNVRYIDLSNNLITGDISATYEIFLLRDIVAIDTSHQFSHEKSTYVKISKRDLYNEDPPERCPRFFGIPFHLTHINHSYSQVGLDWIRFCVRPNNNLKHIDISHNILTRIKYPFTGFNKLEYLNMRAVQLKIFPPDTFQNVSKLKTLLLGQNEINDQIENDVMGNLFGKNRDLIALDLSKCSLKTIPNNFMKSISGIRQLTLEFNQLSFINITHLYRLIFLDISHNRFDYISSDIINSLELLSKKENVTVDIGGNPISMEMDCCEIIHFIRWSKEGLTNLHQSGTYKCIFGKRIKTFNSFSMSDLNDMCPLSSGVIYTVILTVTAGVALLAVTISVMVYRKRWCIKTYILASQRYLKAKTVKETLTRYKFDAFVAYSEKNSGWVRTQLLPFVEGTHRLRLCIHERDFRVGESIEENISHSIENSRMVILVISNSFLTSHWCLMELRLTRQMALERGHDIFIPIILERFDTSKGNRTLFNILNEQTYSEWPDSDPEGQVFFFERLLNVLKPDEQYFDN